MVVIVDRDNEFICNAPRSEMRVNHWIHRSTFIFVVHRPTRSLVVQRRSQGKRWCPGHWDVFFGGVVQ